MSTTPAEARATELAITTIDLSPENHIARLHRAVIGPVGADYYLPVLARLDMRDQAIPIWNWAACLCTLNWMVFRGLWAPALSYIAVVLGVAMAVLVLTQLAAPMADSIQWSLWAGAMTLALLVPGLFGNAWLYAVYRKRLARALSGTASVQDACAMLNRQASSYSRLIWIVLVNLILAGLLLAAWLALPTRHRQGPVDGDVVSAVPAVSAAAAGASAASAPAQAVIATPASVAASAPVRNAALTAPAIQAPQASEMRRSTRFGETPRTPVDIAPRAALSDAAPARAAAKEATGRFIINVGLFAQDDNARRAAAKLRDAGLPVITQELQRASGSLTQVRAGPFATRTEAGDAAQKIRALQLDAVVIRQ